MPKAKKQPAKPKMQPLGVLFDGFARISTLVPTDRSETLEWRAQCIRCGHKVRTQTGTLDEGPFGAFRIRQELDRHICDPNKNIDPWLLGIGG